MAMVHNRNKSTIPAHSKSVLPEGGSTQRSPGLGKPPAFPQLHDKEAKASRHRGSPTGALPDFAAARHADAFHHGAHGILCPINYLLRAAARGHEAHLPNKIKLLLAA